MGEGVGRHNHSAEQIVHKLRDADRLVGEGTLLAQVCKHMEVKEATHDR